MNIGIDARFLGTETGIGRYVEQLVRHLEKIDTECHSDSRFVGTKNLVGAERPANDTGQPTASREIPRHARNDGGRKYFIFLTEKNWDPPSPGFGVVSNFHKIKADFRWYSWQEQVYFPFLIKKYKIDLMHFPHFNVPLFCPCPFVVTIHDLILLHHPSTRASRLGFVKFYLKYIFYRLVLKNAIANSQKILVPSEFTKKDILENFSIPHPTSPSRREGEEGGGGNILENKIVVTYEAASLGDVAPASQEFLSQLGIARPYFLTVGNAYPHKNLERLLRVFKRFNSEYKPSTGSGNNNLFPERSVAKLKGLKPFQLVFVGPDDYFYERMKEFVKNLDLSKDEVIMPGKVSDRELKTLYLNAFAYVFPSLYEGFGLPGLEAMACGAPVVSSDKTSLPEILGEAALYFDAGSDEDLFDKMSRLADDKGLQSRLRARGFGQVKKYNWQSLAAATLRTYETIYELHEPTK